jgi:hypothetical protein
MNKLLKINSLKMTIIKAVILLFILGKGRQDNSLSVLTKKFV